MNKFYARRDYLFSVYLRGLAIAFTLCAGAIPVNGQQPTISSITPVSGFPGSSATITGTNFDATAANNIVYFGATKATITAASASSLTAAVPSGASYKSLSVFNATTGMVGYSPLPFLPSFDNSLYTSTPLNFDPKVDIAVGTNPIFVTIGDLDGDGKPDMVVANNSTSSNSISIYRNISTAGTLNASSFATRVDIATGSAPNGIAIGDVDGDGIPDVVVANQSANTISVFRNTCSVGTISFAAKVDFAINAPYSVAIGDFDGDGKADIVAVNESNSKAGVFRNTSSPGSVSFAARVDLSTGTNPYSVAIGDIDGDGLQDIVSANFIAGSVSVIRNTSTVGTISFAAKSDFSTGASTLPNCVALADIDGDGKLDMIAPDGGGVLIYVFRNTSTSGSISFATKVSFSAGLDPSWISIADMDGDGKPDVAVTNQSGGTNTISVLRNTSTTGSITAGSFASVVNFATGVYPHGMASGDLDGDGIPDMVATNYSAGTISILKNHPFLATPITGTLTLCVGATTTLADATTGGTWVAANTAVATVGSTTGVVSGVTGGTTTVSYSASGGLALKVVTVIALPVPGVIFGPSTVCPTQTIALTDPGGTTGGAWTSSATSVATVGTSGTVTGVAVGTTTISYTVTNSCATFSATRVVTVNPFPAAGVITGTTTLNCSNASVTLSDTASGGVWSSAAATIASVGSSTGIVNYVNAGTATISYSLTVGGCTSYATTVVTLSSGLAVSSASPLVGYPASSVTITGTGFNPTAANDVVFFGATRATVSSASGTSLSVTVPLGATFYPVTVSNQACHMMTYSQMPFLPAYDNSAYVAGSVIFDPKSDISLTDVATCVVVNDIDGDGKPDILITLNNQNKLEVYRNTSTSGSLTAGSFASKVDFTTLTNPTGLAVDDLDGDGKPDVVLCESGSTSVSVFRNTSSPGSFTTSSLAARVDFGTGATPFVTAIRDMDGDGKPDLIVANEGSASVSLLRNVSISGVINTSSFATRVDFSVSSSVVWGLAVGDLDGDGAPDVVASGTGSNIISVFRNTCTGGPFTSGSLAAEVTFSTLSTPVGIVVTDIDGDGKMDIVYADAGAAAISVLRNTASPGSITTSSFASAVSYSTASQPYYLSVGDFDGDGKPDLAVPSANTGFVSVFRNTSTSGTINLSSRQDFATASGGRSVGVGDLDGDGKPDMAVGCFAGSVNDLSILRNDPMLNNPIIGATTVCVGATGSLSDVTGGGTWTSVSTGIATIGSTSGIVTGIATGTTIVSYFAAGGWDTAIVTVLPLPNSGTITGAGTVCGLATVALSDGATGGTWSASNTSIATIGATGVVSGVSAGTLTITYSVTNTCGTAISTQTLLVVTPPVVTSVSPVSGFPSTSITITGANFNTTTTNNIVYFGATRAAVTAASSASLTVTAPLGDTYAPLSVDNTTCFLTGYAQYPFLPTYNNTAYASGSINFDANVDFADGAGNGPLSPAIADIDGDGKPDILVLNDFASSFTVYRNTSTSGAINSGSFAAGVVFTNSNGIDKMVLADMDGDGKLDVVTSNYNDNQVAVFRNTATSGTINSGSFAAKVAFATSLQTLNVEVADLDMDGKPDIIAMNGIGNSISILRNTSTSGSVSFAAHVDFSGLTVGSWGLAVGDLDGDGKPDIAFSGSSSNNFIGVLRNTSSVGSLTTGSLSAAVYFTTTLSPEHIAIADLDGDGKLDLVAANTTANTISVLRNTGSIGSLSFATNVDFTGGTFPHGMAIGDFDGDSKPDIAIVNYTSQTVSVFRNTSTSGSITTGSFAAKIDFPTGSGPQGVAIGDLDGDGKPDLVIANTSASTISVLRNFPALNTPITGTATMCVGATTSLSNATSGGTWSSLSTAIATVGSTGIVTGVSGGTTTISYVAAGGQATVVVTVLPLPNPGTITGTLTVCPVATTTLADAAGGGGWTSTTTSVATIGSTGIVTGVAAGTTTISYTVTNTCGTAVATRVATVNASPAGGSITGTFTVCPTATTTMSDAAGGGAWSSTSTSVATIGTSGIVTGVAAGTTTISYTVTNSCGTAVATTVVTVNPLPNAGSISGTLTVCATATTTLADAAGGGAWSSVTTGVATIDASGIVTGVASGTTTISYTVTNGCGTAVATKVVTVNPLPNAGSITGTFSLCATSTTTLADAAGGGVWSSTTATVATIGTSGIVTGVAAGTTTISYTVTNSCGTAVATTVVIVNPLPNAGSISGTLTVCSTATSTLADAAGGGAWSSVTTGVATIDASGIVTGVASGTTTISYTVTNGCGTAVATKVVTVNPLPNAGSITGTGTVCATSTTTLADAAGGGAWSSTNATVATIGTSGIATGVAAGTTTISYTVSNSCGTAVATTVVTVNPLPNAGSITGTATVCPTATTTLGDGAGGGVWSSVTTAVATVGTTGVVTGVTAGTTTISYTVTNSCGTAVATMVVTVSLVPNAGSITGTTTVCPTATTTLSDGAGSGVWSSVTTAVATVGSTGVVTGVAAGTTTISYTVTNSCGTAVATTVVTVNPLPVAGSITGTAVVCPVATTTLSDAAGGGIWSSVNTAIATVGTAGVVTGVSAGTTTISYTVTNSCGTAVATVVATVSPLPNAGSITGTAIVCPTVTTTLSDAAGGGVWSSITTAVATVGTAGIVTGVAAGTTTISYTVTNSCGTAAATVVATVSPLPNAGGITGTATVCPSATTTLSDGAGSGVWSSVTTAVATVGATGIVTGVAAGTTTISYTVTNSCGTAAATAVVTVNPLPNPGSITGTAVVCPTATTTLSDGAGSGVWSSVTTAVATVGTSGIVTGVTTGTTTISYTVVNGCGTAAATVAVTVSLVPNAGSITGTATVCPAATTTLSDGAGGGVWSSVTPAVATVGATGVVTGVTAGTTTISYTVTNSCGTAAATAVVTVNPLPNAGSITGVATVCATSTTTLSDASGGGAWSSVTPGVATIGATGVVTGVTAGTTTISYTVTNSCGTAAATKVVTVNPLPNAGSITGVATVCATSTTTLSDAAGGGAWSSVTTTVATVGVSGVVTGVTAGTTIISYTVTNSCGTAVATTVVTVNPLPNAGSITGVATVCATSTTTLSDAAGGGVWSSVTAAVATVGATGVVTGVTAGTTTISYTVTNSCGTAAATTVVTVNPLPNAGSITGVAIVCPTSTTTLSDATGGGVWSSVTTAVATVGATGVVTGVTTGTTTISYTVTNGCGTAAATTAVTVSPLPNAGSITGITTVCATSATILSDAAGGGAWSSATPAVGTVNVFGVVSAISAGTTTISYTVTNSCGTAATSVVVTVNPLPNAGSITGVTTVCATSTTTLSDAAGGGVWSSTTTAVATVGATGVVTGVTAGTTTISYTVINSCGTDVVTTIVTVNPFPNAGSITGIGTICGTSAVTLSDAAGGGAWSSVTPGVGTVSASGVVTGISAGTTTISYTVTNGCGTDVAITVVTVNPLPNAGTITGVATVCATSATILSDAAGSGAWSSVAPGVGTVDASGVFTGLTAGTTTISYTVTNSCGTAAATVVVTVNPLPNAGIITGVATICGISTTTLSDVAGGGVWSSVSTAVATVGATGVVTSVTTGTATISYTVSNSCGTGVSTTVVTVSPLPNAGSITGVTAVCATSAIILSDAAGGGVWSSVAPGVGTVDVSGVVTGLTAGTTTISYTVTNSCGTAAATAVVTVNPLPNAGIITGVATICGTSTTTLSDVAGGGAWSSVTTAVATVGATGVVTGVTTGTTTISYTVSNTCGTAVATTIVTVNPLPNAGSITGSGIVCPATAILLSDASVGGVWTSVATTVATVDVFGVVTGVSAGTATISYTVTNSCGTAAATSVVTVNPSPNAGSITGAAPLCPGATNALSDAAGGGVWRSISTGIATVSATGIVTGVSAGTTTISYTVTNSCGTVAATTTVTVNPLPDAGSITGIASTCPAAATTLSDVAGGGVWSSVSTGVATIGATGIVTGVSAGTTTISYTVTNGCGTAVSTKVVTVNPLPNAGSITGTSSVCPAFTIALSDAASGGVWSSSATGVATVNSSGVVTGVAGGASVIFYTVTTSCGSDVAPYLISVVALGAPTAGTISGSSMICAGTFTMLSDPATLGVWSTSNGNASVSSAGLVTGISPGTDTVMYSLTNACGTSTATKTVTIGAYLSAGLISGPSSVCTGSSITLSDPAGGGMWSSSNATASVTSTGMVSGLASGIDTIYYTVTSACGSAVTAHLVNVISIPVAGAITGASTICAGTALTYTSTVPGGVWSASNTTASISTAGAFLGITPGTDTIIYTVTNACGTASATMSVTIGPAITAGSISGPGTVCVGSSITLVDPASGGVWSAVNASATVTPTGILNGLISGIDTISYTVTSSCGAVAATYMVTVNPMPYAGSITGASGLCIGSSATLTDPAPGGAWSASGPHAVVSSGGVVTGMSAGTVTISYNVSNSCGLAVATNTMTIDAMPAAGAISGPASVCVGAMITLTDGVSGGVWGVSNAAATISGGMVTGITAGSDTIYYTVTTSCGTDIATAVVGINPLPFAGTVSGPSSVCPGSSIVLSDPVVGGVWGASNADAAITPFGTVSGVSAGTDTISYSVTNSCGTASAVQIIAISPVPSAGIISGPVSVCEGSAIILTDGTTGGVWSVSNTTASVTGGHVTGIMAGIDTISYTVTTGCGTATTSATVTINPLPIAGTITGASSLCEGSSIALSDAATGGVWSSATPAIATVSGTGTVSGVAGGAANISYTVTNSCGTAAAVRTVTVNPLPGAGSITGASNVCIGASVTMTNTVPGGIWSSTNTTAVISPGGVVTGAVAGTDTIIYTVTNACGTASATKTITVNLMPDAGTISGPSATCTGSSIALSASGTAGGSWSSSNAKATVSGTGTVTGIAQGIDTIKYTVTNSCGSVAATKIIAINALPNAGNITGASSLCPGATMSLADPVSGGAWSSSNLAVASVSVAGAVTAIAPGVANISYTVNNSCGPASASHLVTVLTPSDCNTMVSPLSGSKPDELNVYPNPNDGVFRMILIGSSSQTVDVVVTNMVGQKVAEFKTVTNKEYSVTLNQPPGVYFLSATTEAGKFVARVTVK